MSEDQKDGFKVSDRRGETKQEPKPSSHISSNASSEETAALPEINFSTFVLSLSTSALIHMGVMEDPHTKQKQVDLAMAKHEIDIIEMLAEKTKGNLSKQEENLLGQMLYELRMRFVQASK
ncbi:MAG: DUF1844 domain-containing protein [Bdellovibrionota bacterium]